MPYTDNVSPLTDLALVYGADGFRMGFGFETHAMPQVRIMTCNMLHQSLYVKQDQRTEWGGVYVPVAENHAHSFSTLYPFAES